ncbi:TniQ family protein [Streptomyces sp. NPDC056231]|uniref:TniQ family protein n=1 Tax=Streptomyces sp. NPDC056231 TaxID=3345755 RepID=UPI003AAC8AED
MGPRLRQLPRTIEPLHRETFGSYLGRLAAANRISHQELSAHIQDPDRIHPGKLTTLHAIHCLSGHPVDRLPQALPDLRTAELNARFTAQPLKLLPDKGWTTQPVCTRCLAGLGVTTHASHHVPVSTNICLRHGRWIGRYGHQLELHTVPEVIRRPRLTPEQAEQAQQLYDSGTPVPKIAQAAPATIYRYITPKQGTDGRRAANMLRGLRSIDHPPAPCRRHGVTICGRANAELSMTTSTIGSGSTS